MNILSLFDGASCGQVALNRAGIKYDNYFASEIDKHAMTVTLKNFPNTQMLGDITAVQPNHLQQIDLLIGGSPCQGFSRAGTQLNFDDPRSKLFFEYVRLLRELSPKYFLLENVQMKKEWEDVVTEHLGVAPIKVNSADFSAQNRVRLYWTNIPVNFEAVGKDLVVKDIMEPTVADKFYLSDKAKAYMRRLRNGRPRLEYHKNDINKKSSTLVAVMWKGVPYGVITDGDEIIRRLTPIECERLQTLPDNYTEGVSDTQRYKMLGNGWTVEVISQIFKQLQ